MVKEISIKNDIDTRKGIVGKTEHGSWSSEIPSVYIIQDPNNMSDRKKLDSVFIGSIEIIESIFSLFPICYFYFNDQMGIKEKAALNGNEIFEISLQSISNKKPVTILYEIQKTNTINHSGPDGKIQEHKITLMPYKKWMNSIGRRISKGYANKTISAIVKDLAANEIGIKDANITETAGKLESYCIPYWSVKDSLSQLQKIAIDGKNNAGYMCWINMLGVFNFRPINELYEQDTKWTFIQNLIRADDDPFSHVILSYVPSNVRKDLSIIGLRGTTNVGYDFYNKNIIQSSELFSKHDKENNAYPYRYFNNIDDEFGYYEYSAWENSNFSMAEAKSKVNISMNSQCQPQITVRGLTQMSPGHVIEIRSSGKSSSDGWEKSTEIEGKWLINTIYHSWIQGHGFKQTYTLMRSGYNNSENKNLSELTQL